MANLVSTKLGLLILSLLLFNCKSKDQVDILIQEPIEIFTNDYLGKKLLIKDFNVDNAKIETPADTNSDDNYFIITLPEGYKDNFIIPTINLSNKAQQISPKSGEKIIFEGRSPIEYTVITKDSQIVKFKVIVVKEEQLEAELLTKEWVIKRLVFDDVITIRVKNTGTYQGLILNIYDEKGILVQSGGSLYDSSGICNFRIESLFRKGNFKLVLIAAENYLKNKRKSAEFFLTVKNGDKAITKIYSGNPFENGGFNKVWSKNEINEIKGLNFDANKTYSVVFVNDFLSYPIILTPKFIDENTLSLQIPNHIKALSCGIYLKENENIIDDVDGAIVDDFSQYIKSCQFSTNFERGSEYFLKRTQPFTFEKSQAFGAYYVVSFGDFIKESYARGGLKLINVDNREEFLLEGKFMGGIWDASASYWSFTIPENVPKGFYEVYGINPQVNSGRYWRKLEVK
jgi:hypothetical protein